MHVFLFILTFGLLFSPVFPSHHQFVNPNTDHSSGTRYEQAHVTLSHLENLTATSYTIVANCEPYWLENIKHQGKSAFNPEYEYQVFRNVKDFGAKGDGVTDDTAAINAAISSGNRCGPGCQSSTTTPAIIYFPQGVYVISSSIIDFYHSMLIGNPNCLPVLKATPNFTGFGLIDGNPYQPNGRLAWGSTNTFFRQIRNFILDMTDVPAEIPCTGIHWPTAQATSIQNVIFHMASGSDPQHQGVFIEEGSGGFMNDLTFYGGLYGLNVGNQQFTMRNISFYNVFTAINQIWNWGWTYKSISIHNCSVGLNISSGGSAAQTVGSVTLIDSIFTNTPLAIVTAKTASAATVSTAGSLILENVKITNVAKVISGINGTTLLSGTSDSMTIAAWGQGHAYEANYATGQQAQPRTFQGSISPNYRPQELLTASGTFYERSKPQYQEHPSLDFMSAREAGARGNGLDDDTIALQELLIGAADADRIVFIDSGTYRISQTLYIPKNSRIVGEAFPVIMSSGEYFDDIEQPRPVIMVGRPGETGTVEWSDTIISTHGQQRGAILIQWNLASGGPSGMWDVHTRIGGFSGSDLQVFQCPTTPRPPIAPIKTTCMGAFMGMHITRSASGLYVENCWFWTADHDLDDVYNNNTQITIYTGRGVYVESADGPIWLVGTASEHFSLYQYQFWRTRNVFMGQVQTETAYYQPTPNTTLPFPTNAEFNDPSFSSIEPRLDNSANGWGMRISHSETILGYGIGLYSFFNSYNTSCSNIGNNTRCQSRILSIENHPKKEHGTASIYNLNTVGVTNMITWEGIDIATRGDNINVFPDTIALFRSSN